MIQVINSCFYYTICFWIIILFEFSLTASTTKVDAPVTRDKYDICGNKLQLHCQPVQIYVKILNVFEDLPFIIARFVPARVGRRTQLRNYTDTRYKRAPIKAGGGPGTV
jgi:hypothetical protein